MIWVTFRVGASPSVSPSLWAVRCASGHAYVRLGFTNRGQIA